jgi:hypothetical protein
VDAVLAQRAPLATTVQKPVELHNHNFGVSASITREFLVACSALRIPGQVT